jgi:hypothetical protein
MDSKRRNGQVIHYLFRGGRRDDMRTECGKDTELMARGNYTTHREKVTCRKCLRASLSLPDLSGEPEKMVRFYNVQLEVDCRRGVIYGHCRDRGISILRVCGVPMPAMRALAGTPVEFAPQLDITLRENMPPIAGVSNLALAAPEPQTRKMNKKEKALPPGKKTPKIKPKSPETPRFRTRPPKKPVRALPQLEPGLRWKIYADGKHVAYSTLADAKAAMDAYRRERRIGRDIVVTVRMSIAPKEKK